MGYALGGLGVGAFAFEYLGYRAAAQSAESARQAAEADPPSVRRPAPLATTPPDVERIRRDAAALLGPWMPLSGQVEPLSMSLYDGPKPYPAVCASTAEEGPEALMARIAPGGWTLDHEGDDYRQ